MSELVILCHHEKLNRVHVTMIKTKWYIKIIQRHVRVTNATVEEEVRPKWTAKEVIPLSLIHI